MNSLIHDSAGNLDCNDKKMSIYFGSILNLLNEPWTGERYLSSKDSFSLCLITQIRHDIYFKSSGNYCLNGLPMKIVNGSAIAIAFIAVRWKILPYMYMLQNYLNY